MAAAAGLTALSLSGAETNNLPVPKPISIGAMVTEALNRNPELAFYQAEIRAAKAGRKTAGLWSPPELDASIGRKSVQDRNLDAEGMAWSVSLRQPIEWPGRLGLRKAIANGDVALAELGLERFRAAVRHRVQSLGYQLAVAQARAAAARAVAQRFQELSEVLVARDPAGLTPLLETRVIEASAVKAGHEAAAAQRETEHLAVELNYLRGQPPADAVRVQDATPRFTAAPQLGELFTAAATNNFDLRVRVAELEQQGFHVALARHERFPAFTVGPYFSEERAGDRERIAGISLSAPLPLWQGNGARREAAEARRTQAEAALDAARRQVERDVVDAAREYEHAIGLVARWRPDAIAHFRGAAELADRHYRLGAVPVSTYVELQRQYVEATQALLDARQLALESGQRLQALTGLEFDITFPDDPQPKTP